ncbi:MAG TPA: hypothetical protein VJT09_01590 [Pyrinomonadaceae bacterium]|nr:hypothetical protein [Pyrinomonadaceae bacterium]
MLSRKSPFVALGLLLALTGILTVLAQEKKKPKDREIVTNTGPQPVIQLSEHASIITPCADNLAEARIPLTATVTNFSTSDLRYSWRVSGGQLNGDGPNATWDLSAAAPGTYTATVEVDNKLDNGCAAFTSTKVIVRECPPPPIVCPNVSIYCPDAVTLGQPVTFAANLSGGTPNITPTYNWTVSNGTIISGQGTPSIQVDTTGLGGQSITATLSVEGYRLNCNASCTVQVPRKISSTLVDFYPPIRLNDEKARLDNFAIQLQNDPNAKGYIVVFGGAKAGYAEKQKRIKRAYDYLVNARGISADRLVTLEGGTRDVTTTELWIVPLGADPPVVK